MKIVKPLEESGLLIKGASETIRNEPKNRKTNFLVFVIGYIMCSFIRNSVSKQKNKSKKRRQGVIKSGDGVIQAAKGTIRAGQHF